MNGNLGTDYLDELTPTTDGVPSGVNHESRQPDTEREDRDFKTPKAAGPG